MKPGAESRPTLDLFLVFGVQQLLAVRAIVEERTANPGSECICLLYIDDKYAATLENCEVLDCRSRSALDYLRQIRRFKQLLHQWQSSYAEIRAYLPHPWFYPANYLLFADLDVRRFLVPDGVVNYCEFPVAPRTHPSMWARRLLGLLVAPLLNLFVVA